MMSDTPQVNDDPRVPPDEITPSMSELKALCSKTLVEMAPQDTTSFIQGFYIGYFCSTNSPVHPYVAINLACNRFDRLIEEANL